MLKGPEQSHYQPVQKKEWQYQSTAHYQGKNGKNTKFHATCAVQYYTKVWIHLSFHYIRLLKWSSLMLFVCNLRWIG